MVSRGLEAFRETETYDMKHPIRTYACGAALFAAIAVIACGHSVKAGAASPARAATPVTQPASMTGMDHSAMPGMQHGSPSAAPLTMAPPTSNAAIAASQPAVTLRADEFDAPAPSAVEEAAKAASGMSHSMEQATPKAPPQHDHKPPSAQPHQHGGGEAS
jgi:hypothetical protein